MTAVLDRVVHAVLPGDVDDPASPSGGNAYDRRVCGGLGAHGWRVHVTAIPGSWPNPDEDARAALGRMLTALPDRAVVLADGLVACGVPQVVVPQARRLRLAVLVHLPLADERGLGRAAAVELDRCERATLRAAGAVVVTSPSAVGGIARHELAPDRVHVATPGVDPAAPARGTDGASRLLCVASVTPRKAQDVLLDALAPLSGRHWSCVCAGPLHRDPGFVARLRGRIARHGLQDRFHLAGPLAGAELEAAYAATDLAVLVSWTETYGMAVTEALARAIPVLTSDGGALPDTLGRAPDGTRPGMVVPAGDVGALTAALRLWFDQPALRDRRRRSAADRSAGLPRWERTVARVHDVLDHLRAVPAR